MNILNNGFESAKHDTQELFEANQAERSRLLGSVRDLQLATRLLVQAEAQRLAVRSPGDARIGRLVATERTLRDRVAVLGTELEVAAIRVPPVSKTDTLVHGRITDDAQRAPGRVTAMLVRADGSTLEGVRPVEVDEAGYYAFVIDPVAAAKLTEQDKLSVVVQRGDMHVAPTAASNFTLKAGTVAVKDVALGDAELRRLQLRADIGVKAGVAAPEGLTKATKATKTRKGG
jgi:hypothetical protein